METEEDWNVEPALRRLNRMEFLDLRSGALAIFFLVMMLNLVLLGWSTTPARSPVRRQPTAKQDDENSMAA